jgi:ribose/xylose/arabinose/galactoside ABC-type transport system permease subunit
VEKALVQGWSRIYQGIRAVVREVAAATYVFIATSLGYSVFEAHPWLTFLLEPSLTILAGFVMAWAVAGPRWTTHLVGVFVALIHMAFVVLRPGAWEEQSVGALVLAAAIESACGALGAYVGHWRRSRTPQA